MGFISRTVQASDVAAVLREAADHQAQRIVVGMPFLVNGRVGKQARSVQLFCDALREQSALAVVTCDERYSTAEAKRLLRDAGRKPSREKGLSDAAAAAVILQSYLDGERPR